MLTLYRALGRKTLHNSNILSEMVEYGSVELNPHIRFHLDLSNWKYIDQVQTEKPTWTDALHIEWPFSST